MSVYVDQPMTVKPRFKNWCHMFADSVEELHHFADGLGLKRDWFQGVPTHPHYDISPKMRDKALQNGAKELDRAQTVEWLRKQRKELR